MSHRQFTDSLGRLWDVWAVAPPARIERRRQQGEPRGDAAERRRRVEVRLLLTDAWSRGWLCFQTGVEKRRLAPYPPDWMDLPLQALRRLCDIATTKPPWRTRNQDELGARRG